SPSACPLSLSFSPPFPSLSPSPPSFFLFLLSFFLPSPLSPLPFLLFLLFSSFLLPPSFSFLSLSFPLPFPFFLPPS
ncbi:hypothetical protein ACXWRS_12365, partial [Streptococcus pyogenes]